MSKFPATRRFAFELELEVSSVLGFSIGELGALALDGLFVLDGEGRLFPGVTTPDAGNRLAAGKIGAIGYTRHANTPSEDRYTQLVLQRKGRPTKSIRNLDDRLTQAIEVVSEGVFHQHMLLAKLKGLADKCGYRGAITDADRTIAETFITAAETVSKVVETSVRPVL